MFVNVFCLAILAIQIYRYWAKISCLHFKTSSFWDYCIYVYEVAKTKKHTNVKKDAHYFVKISYTSLIITQNIWNAQMCLVK